MTVSSYPLPAVVIVMGLLYGPIPALFTAATSTLYVVICVSPKIVTPVAAPINISALLLPCSPYVTE